MIGALLYMHNLGIVHADLNPSNILLHGAGAFQDAWLGLLANASGAASANSASRAASACEVDGHESLPLSSAQSHSPFSGCNEPFEVTYHLPGLFQVEMLISIERLVSSRTHIFPKIGFPKRGSNVVVKGG